MPKLADDDVKVRMSDALKDVQYLLSVGADKNEILTGTQNRRGLNHVNELFMMLPDVANTGEFKIRS